MAAYIQIKAAPFVAGSLTMMTAGEGCSVSNIPTRWQQAAFELSSAGTLGSGFLFMMDRAIETWGQRNIKAIGFWEIQDLIHSQKVSDKTKSNMRSGLHGFFNWVWKREKIQMPEFPEIGFELGFRKIIDKETQESIIDEIYQLTHKTNPTQRKEY